MATTDLLMKRGSANRHSDDNGVDDDDDDDDDESMSDEQQQRVECFNCHRRNVLLQNVHRDLLKTRRPFCTFSVITIGHNATQTFCDECCAYLCREETNGDDWTVIWPAFIWKFLADRSDYSVSTQAGGECAWQFVPTAWRHWWLDSLRFYFPAFYDVPGVSLLLPPPHFEDISSDLRRFETMMQNLRLGEIKNVCNELNFPTILCPWGCSTFPQDIGVLPLPTVFHHVLRKRRVRVQMSARSRNALCKCLSMRPDYLDPNHPRHICSKRFTVRPCVAFHPVKGMSVITCDEHCHGTIQRYLHVPKSLLGLPSRLGDQLAHCVMHHRTIKPMIAKKYSTTYQLAMQRGSFAGIDLCCLKSSGDFRSRSAILHSHEALSLACREDIRALLDQLERDGFVSGETARGFRKASSTEHHDGGATSRSEYSSGSTFVTFLDCMKMQRELATVHEITIQVFNHHVLQYVTFTPNWLRSIVWIHPCDDHGALFHSIPNILTQRQTHGRDVRLMFVLLAAVTTLPFLWEHLAANIRTGQDWPGFFLTYATRKVIYYHRSTRKSDDDPFTEARDYSAHQMFDKLRVPPAYDSPQLLPLMREYCDPALVQFWEYNIYYNPRDPDEPLDVSDVRRQHNMYVCSRARQYLERGGDPLPATFEADATTFELRFICMENDKSECVIYARHGGQFSGWFTTRENDHEYMYASDDDELFHSGAWTFAVYMNTTPPDTDELRREFLSYTGGQTTAICATHDVPLIVVAPEPTGSPWRCPGLPHQGACGGKLYYGCPKRGCHTCLCKKCLHAIPRGPKCLLHRSRIQRHTSPNDSGTNDNNHSTNDSERDRGIDDEEENEFQDIPDAMSTDTFDADVVDESLVRGDDDDASDAANNFLPTDDDIYGLPHTHDLHDGTDEPIFDDELDDNPSPYAVPDLPRTISHANTIPDILPDSRSDMIGNIVLLNGLGSLLVRRRHNLNFSRSNMEFLQRRIISRYGYSIPMLYAEAAIYPSIFPFDCGSDPSILGAIPSAFLSQEKNSAAHGVASLSDHARNRLFLAGIGTATNYQYQTFLFDAMVNNNCSNDDSRVVLNRGVAESNTPAGLKTRSKGDHFFSDSIDNRQNVLNLTEAQKYHPNNLFLTITANQKLTFGLSPIKEYLDNGEAIKEVEELLGRRLETWEHKEYERALHDASCTLMTRCWLKIRYIIMTYIMHSFEEPLRKLITAFWRDEYQGDQGNLSHVHALLQARLDLMNPEEVRQFHDVIRGFNADIVRVDEVDDLQARGIFESKNDWYEMMEHAKTILTHRSRRNLRRTGTGDNDLKRRDINFAHITPDQTAHCAVRIDPGHNPEVIALLAECGLCDRPPPNKPWEFKGEADFLTMERYIPPVRRRDNNMSPVNSHIFASMLSMMNIQRVGGYGVNRYVTKYITKIDENSHTVCSVNPRDESQVFAKTSFLHNTKISSSSYNEQKRINDQRDKTHPQGRTLARTEIVQLLSREPQVHTNLEFIKVDTTPLEDRAGLHKIPETSRRRNDDEGFLERYQRMAGNNTLHFVIMSDYVRYDMSFAPWRLFTPSQVLLINDNFSSEVTVSKVTVFSVRPPELRDLFPTLTNYFRWFHRKKCRDANKFETMSLRLNENLNKSEWVDGFGYTVRLRTEALDEVGQYMHNTVPGLKRQPNREIIELVDRIIALYHRATGRSRGMRHATTFQQWSEIRQLFLHDNMQMQPNVNHHPLERVLPIPVHSCVKPSNTTKFLFHILLSMGEFTTELDLLGFATLKDAFVYANLVDDTTNESLHASVTGLIRRYILSQIRYYPISTRLWGKYILQAARALRTAIIDGDIAINEMPACLYTKLRSDVLDRTKQRIETLFRSTVTAAYAELEPALRGQPNAPTLEQLLAKERNFDGNLPRTHVQTPESFEEQQKVRDLIRDSFANYIDPTRTTLAKSVMIAGGPGNGKTHCLMYGTLYYSTNGRLIVPCAILAERAMTIGGEHFHRLFHFPVTMATAQRLAELAVIAILRRPESVELLLSLDALALDESGTLSSTLFSALDIIMRRIRGVSAYMGGMMIITTIDDKQLRPVTGYPLLLSPHILTCFRVIILSESVRSADDPLQQRVIDISRYSDKKMRENPECIDEVVDIISRECNFVPDFDHESITPTTLRVFARKEAVFEAVDEFYTMIEQQQHRADGVGTLTRKLSDDIQIALESHGNHDTAKEYIRKLLDRDTKEPRKLLFFRGAIYQFTFNDPSNTFTQSRLAFLLDVPTQHHLDSWEDIRVFAAPPGVKCAPPHTINREQLHDQGWSEVVIGAAPDYVHTYGRHGIRAQRRQYGLRPHISATIHAIQGATLLALATSIEMHKKEKRLWEKAQWLVLVSRTNYLRHMIFVGDKQETLRMIRYILDRRSQFNEYMEHVLHVAAGHQSEAPTIRHRCHPFRSRDRPLPRDTTGFAYLIVSAQTWARSYIGETEDLHRRLELHNSGQGARETRTHGTWLLVACVVGFDNCKTSRRHFQDDWQNVSWSRIRHEIRRNGGGPDMETAITAAQDLIAGRINHFRARAYRDKTLRLDIHADIDRRDE